MLTVSAETTLVELAALVSQALERAGIPATLSGGAAVALFSHNEYQSSDLDFVSSARLDAIASALADLGFRRRGKTRQFDHPGTVWYLEFPAGPLAFGNTQVSDGDALSLQTTFGPIRVVTPTHIIMDRLAAYTHWRDLQSLDQAVMVARNQAIDWVMLEQWAKREGITASCISLLRDKAGK